MKSIVLLLVVMIALIGAAAAWEDTGVLNYQYTQTVSQEAGQVLYPFSGGNGGTLPVSGAYASARLVDGNAADIAVQNQLVSVTAPLVGTSAQNWPNTKNTLIQGGSGKITAVSYDPEALGCTRYTGDANVYQQLTLSGLYTANSAGALAPGTVSAIFAESAEVGGPANILGTSTLNPSVSTNDPPTLIEPVLGGSTSVDFNKLQDDTTTYSGMTNTTAFISGPQYITTSTAGTSTFSVPAAFASFSHNN